MRQSDKTIGVPKELILQKLEQLIGNTKYFIDNKVYDSDEISARFHHGLVSIHVFPNGNGRHARLMTEVLQIAEGYKTFSWGRSDLYNNESIARKEYIAALKLADKGEFAPLLEFLRR